MSEHSGQEVGALKAFDARLGLKLRAFEQHFSASLLGPRGPKVLGRLGMAIFWFSNLSILYLVTHMVTITPADVELADSEIGTSLYATKRLAEIAGAVDDHTAAKDDPEAKLYARQVTQQVIEGAINVKAKGQLAALPDSKETLARWKKAELALLQDDVGSAKPEVVDMLRTLSYTSLGSKIERNTKQDVEMMRRFIWCGLAGIFAAIGAALSGIASGLRTAARFKEKGCDVQPD